MKAAIRHLGAFLIIGLWVTVFAQQQQEPAAVRLNKLTDRVFEVLDGRGARGGLCLGDDFAVLIDSKMDSQSVQQTLAAVKEVTDKPVRFLVNTHSDVDHVRGNQYLPAGVTFIAHENCRKEFFHPGRDGGPAEWNSPELARFVPSLTFRDKMDIHLGSRKIELWYFGVGHTTGDTVVYLPDEKIAFLGDQLFIGRPQLIHAYKGGNSLKHVETLRKMLGALEAVTFCSGHAEPADRKAIEAHIAEVEAMQARVRDLQGQGKTLEEAKSTFKQNEAALVETIWNELRR